VKIPRSSNIREEKPKEVDELWVDLNYKQLEPLQEL